MAGELAALIGKNIRLRREELGLNQRELAQKIADPAAANTHVSEWERGVRKPSDRYLPLIAEALERPVDWFMRNHDQPAPDLTEMLRGEPTQLDRVEQTLTELVRRIERLERTKPSEPLEPQSAEEILDDLRVLQRGIEAMLGRAGRDVGKRDLGSRRAKDHQQESEAVAAAGS